MKITKRLAIMLCSLVVILTGCGGYSDASVDVPANWANYTVGNLQFRFAAGWKSSNWDPVQLEMDTQVQTLGTNNNLAIFGRLASPAADKGTVNYVDFGYWDTGRDFEDSEMESIMLALNDLVVPLKKLGITSEDEQSSKIRIYGEVTALTLSYTVTNDQVDCLMQVALVPHGTKVYLISYADFSVGKDDSTLEQLLSSLSFT